MKLINVEEETEFDLEGCVEEWGFFIKLMDVMEPEFLLGILEHYDLEYWL